MALIPNMSVDCVVFGFDFETLNVLLEERKLKDPDTGELVIDDYTITGYHIHEGEALEQAAITTLQNKTGIKDIYLEQFHTFGELNRINSPQDRMWIESLGLGIAERVFTVGYFSLVDSRAVNPTAEHDTARWFPIHDLPPLAFDHARIIEKAKESLLAKVRVEPIIFELLPEKFTISQLQKAFECILGVELDRRNFRKKVMQMKYVIPLDEKQKGVAHKPAQVFIFSKDVYNRTRTMKQVMLV